MAMRTARAIFYHIPKTGGTWVEKVLSLLDREKRGDRHVWAGSGRNPFGLFRKHAVPDDVRPSDKAGLVSFCFVRHPVAWYRSFWMARRGGPLDHGTRFGAERYVHDSFERFVENVLRAYPRGFVTALYQCYTRADVSGIDIIGRQETLRADLTRALTLAGDHVDEEVIRRTPARNVSRHRPPVSPNLDRRIRAAERWVIERWYPEGCRR